MTQPVHHHRISRPNERGNHTEICHISRWKQERGRFLQEICQSVFQIVMNRGASADEPRGCGAYAPTVERLFHRLDHWQVVTGEP